MVGQEIDASNWLEVSQEDVDAFADVTGDHQYIHVDPERARQTSLGGTIVHGYFTLSLLPKLLGEIVEYEGFSFGLNYGLNRLRFPAPMPVGARVRIRMRIDSVEDVPGGIQIQSTVTFECDASEKPVCVAETLIRRYV